MSFLDCLKAKQKSGILSKRDIQKFEDQFEALKKRYTQTMGDENAAAQAAREFVNTQKARTLDKKRNQINGALAQERIVEELEKSVSQGVKFDTAVRNLLENSLVRKQSIFKQNLNGLDSFVEEFRSKFAGLFQRRDGMADVVSEMLGKQTDSAEASQFAQALRKTFDIAHARYKNAGGVIGTLDNYFPQVHDHKLMQQVSFDDWYEYIRPRLDTDKMIDFDTGLPFDELKLVSIMRDNYEEIVTQGKSTLQKRAAEGKKSFGFGGEVSQRKQSGRFYHFKDAESFLEYNNKFGVGEEGLFDSVINHLESYSRDTAILEILGPTPNSLMRHLDLQMGAQGVSSFKQKWTRGMYDILTGFTDTMAGESPWFRVSSNLRNLFSSAYLGSAPVSAISDTAFIAATASLNGLSSTRALGKYLKLLNPANKADRELAKRSGYIADIANGSALSDVRFTGENMGGKATSWLAQFTNRASGLHAMTKAAADAISLEAEGVLGDLISKKTIWNNIDGDLKKSLSAHGISQKEWDVFLKSSLFEPENGIKFLRSQEVSLAKGVDFKDAMSAANKMDDFIQTMRNTATNEPTLRTRSFTTGAFMGDARRGTVLRMLSQSLTQFKSFPITVMFNHILPSFKNLKPLLAGNFKEARYKHAAWTAIGSTVLGGVALQMEQIVKGKDARDMEDHKFWMAATLKGGGLGLFGDFFFGDYSRFGRTPIEDVVGPTAGLASDVGRVFMGNFQKAVSDESGDSLQDFTTGLFNLAKRNTPGQNLWYSRLAVERLIFDQLEAMIDPNFQNRAMRMENRMLKETGQEYFWAKGELAPDRPPELAERP